VTDDFNVDITPSVTTYELYQIASYTHWFAIGEFIDNSITSAFLNWDELQKLYGGKYQLEISIDFNNDDKALTIVDNAAGIARNEIQRALRAGDPPADKSLLSVHGVGMKMSSFWMGRNLNIKTWPLNTSLGYEVSVDLDEIKKTKSAITQVQEISAKPRPGTVIKLSKINEDKLPKGTGVAKLKLLLTSMYRLYLTNTEKPVKIHFNGKPLMFKNPEILNAPFWPDREGPLNDVPVRWEREFTYTSGKGQMVFGKVGLLETMSRDLSGFMLHYKGKGMGGIGAVDSSEEISQQDVRDAREYYRPSRIFGQEGSYRYQRFTGVFDISDLGKTSSTDSIKWGPDEEHDFIEALVEFLKDPKFNMWAMAENYQPRKALKLKEADEKPNASTFSVEEVVTLSEYFNTQIHGEEILHPDSDEQEVSSNDRPRALNNAPVEDFVSTKDIFSVKDAKDHIHHFEPQFIDNPDFDLFYVNSSSEDRHEIRINVGHPFLRRLQWGNPDVREAIIQMIYLMSVPEVFLPLRNSRTAYRAKINEIVDSTLARLNRSTGDAHDKR
jgi:Histidine kinase-, DNA gyrase B-, and HSP90-like ATPase